MRTQTAELTAPEPTITPSPGAPAGPVVAGVSPGHAAPIAGSERSLAPDIARGAMLLFIALANVPLYLWNRPLDTYGHIADGTVIDRALHVAEQLLVADRSRPMFAILYGFGIAVMADNLARRGVAPAGVRRVLARRSLALIGLGVLHALLLFFGDILSAYGATGLVALALVHRSDRALRRWLWVTGIYVLLVQTPVLALLVSGVIPFPAPPPGEPLYGDTYLEHMVMGATGATVQIGMALLFLTFVPLVVAGMLVHRLGWLSRPAEHLPRLRRTVAIAMTVNVLSATPVALLALGAWHPDARGWAGAVYLTVAGGMVGGLAYVCGFALLAHRWAARGRRGFPGALAALGERSLSGYLAQSFLMAPLLAAWGLGLGEGLGYAGAFAVATAAWAVTLLGSVALDRAGRRGPFDALLRRVTYGPGHRAPSGGGTREGPSPLRHPLPLRPHPPARACRDAR
ncbi:DUF418 domain-containing protein [Actinotalea sp. K2]|uniref:DUF418 domain-containing protein n=1 Tax=Actinotalea sp. K2 TaxID=2939438 RepID=UPI0020180F0A|nr:DUF418 domain-containing protein [Actinotalea sp. K2]MCL3861065.1 DUF418 domain-containing protein [Actinotalea sp. K2]